ncbi:MAG TPA: Xaa-Pro peptidase family protein [Bryobacteraceae bacterium]|nr:Xaa-Pro peptidase family protein [Bryobacteraceae bacterium]
MKYAALLLLVSTLDLPAAAPPPPIPASEYRDRRQALRAAMGEHVLILFGSTEGEHGDIRSGFFQEPNFYYLTGWTEPGAILVLTAKSEALLLPRRDPALEIWTGAKADPANPQLRERLGFESVSPAEALESRLPGWLAEGRAVYTLLGTAQSDAVRRLAPLREMRSAAPLLARLRMTKSPAELAWIQFATDAAVEAHLAGWRRTRAGATEYQVASAISGTYFEMGCQRHAYAPIAGSGSNSTILHYSRNSRRMDSGEVLLVDAGPECSMYASDLTRTVPVDGKWSKRQREIYNLVLGAQQAVIDAVRPGILLGGRDNKVGLHKVALDYFEKHGVAKFFTHGIGHHVGLDVHDAFEAARPLGPGMVITVEPGLYLPEEGIGVRIEDMVVVTESGSKVLSAKLPRDADVIERALQSDRR